MSNVRRHMQSPAYDEALYRLGTSVLGLLAGFAVALLLFLPLALTTLVSAPLSHWLFAGATSGVVCGALAPRLAVAAFEGAVHCYSGLMAAILGSELPSSQRTPQWLRASAWVGALYFPVFWLSYEVVSWLARR